MKASDKKRAIEILKMIYLEVEDNIDISYSGGPNMEMKISVWADQLKAILERQGDCDYCENEEATNPLELMRIKK